MIDTFLKGARARRAISAVLLTAMTGTAIAQSASPAGNGQTVADPSVPDTGLNIPTNLQIFGKMDPNIRKPTAIVNDTVITGTDVDQRVALIEAANSTKLTDEDRDRVKLQICAS